MRISDLSSDVCSSDLFSQELRLTSPSSSKVQWVAGLFYYSDSIDREERFVVTSVAPLPRGLGGDNTALQNASTKSYAAFGQVTIPFAQIFELTLGARISRDKKDVFQQAVHNAPRSEECRGGKAGVSTCRNRGG